MTETLRDGMTGSGVGEGDECRLGGRTVYVDSWSPGARKVWLRDTAERGGALTEIEPEAVGLYVGWFYAYTAAHPRWKREPHRRAPWPDSASPEGVRQMKGRA